MALHRAGVVGARRAALPFLVAFCWVSLVGSVARAWVLQAPRGGEFITLPQGRVLCGPVPEGWKSDDARKRLRAKHDADVGQASLVALAPHDGECGGSTVEETTLVVTGDHPNIDATSVSIALDAGRLELRGDGLEGTRVGFSGGGKSGTDVCLNVTHDRDHDVCALNIDRTLPADPKQIELHWVPAGGRLGTDVFTFDKHGELLANDRSLLPVTRLLISRMFPETRMVDVAHGEGKLPLIHPEAVAGADCWPAHCEPTPEGLLIGAVPAAAPKLGVRLQLRPHVLLTRGDVLDNVVGDTLSVLRCPITIVSGEPLRNVDELKVLVRLDPACMADVQRLRWLANGEPSEVVHVESLPEGVYVLLWVGRLSSERLSLVAARPDDNSVLAVATEKTVGIPPLMASMTLPGFGEIDFIPRNRSAFVNVSHVAGKGELVPVSVPGAYTVERSEGGYLVRGASTSGGYTALRFAYHVEGVPDVFADTDFGQITDTVQRPIREASIPAPIGASSITDQAIVELFCRDKSGQSTLIQPGTTTHIPYEARDSCRLVLHRERIPVESGEQRLDVDVSVSAVGGVDRPESRWTQHLVLRHSKDLDVVWIRGAKQQFDRISVNITHIVDEWLYGGDARRSVNLPSAQWSVVTEDANFKFYATATIPGTLYRFSNDPQELGNGPLSLNFGVLSRLTWLDSDGREGLLALEAGMMGMGLATDKDRQLAAVAGLGVAIPLANANQPTQAAVNIHAWVSYTFGTRHGYELDAMGNATSKPFTYNNWAFVFGPSITIGSVGALL
jgi:hypothetical protein